MDISEVSNENIYYGNKVIINGVIDTDCEVNRQIVNTPRNGNTMVQEITIIYTSCGTTFWKVLSNIKYY